MYQVRFEWGVAGLERLAPADVVIVIDVLRFTTTVAVALESGGTVPLDAQAHAVSLNGAAVAEAAAGSGRADARPADGSRANGGTADGSQANDSPAASAPRVLLGCLRNATGVAQAVLAEQHRRAQRTSVNVIAAGELDSRAPDAAMRFSVEDFFCAGAIIAALSEIGIDHTSPEAAAAAEAFLGLRGGIRHLVGASGSARELAARGEGDEVARATQVDATTVVPVLRGRTFTAA